MYYPSPLRGEGKGEGAFQRAYCNTPLQLNTGTFELLNILYFTTCLLSTFKHRLSFYFITLITFDIINAMRYYDINDKEFHGQRNGKIIQTGIITKDP